MSRHNKTVKKLSKLVEPYGLAIVDGKNHREIYRGQVRVYVMSSTPSCAFFADNTLKDLAHGGFIPAEVAKQRCR